MNTCVADDNNIVNIQGIRYVTWGENSSAYSNRPGSHYVTVTYKGNHNTFIYQNEISAREFFNKIREAMTKAKEVKA